MIVVDASVVVNALSDDDQAGSIARRVLRREAKIAAPTLIDVETVSVLRKRWIAGDLTLDRFRTAIDHLLELRVARYSAIPFLHRMHELRENVTPYDALYIALAESLDCTLVTSDRWLAAAPGPTCEIRVIHS